MQSGMFAGKILPVAEESGINQILQSVGAVSYYAADIKAHVLAEAEQNLSPANDKVEECVPDDQQESGSHMPLSIPNTCLNFHTELDVPIFSEAVLPQNLDASSADSNDDFEFLGTFNSSAGNSSAGAASVFLQWTCPACTYVHSPPVESSFLACAVCGTLRDGKKQDLRPKFEEELTHHHQECDSSDHFSFASEDIYAVDDDDDDEDYEQDSFNSVPTWPKCKIKRGGEEAG